MTGDRNTTTRNWWMTRQGLEAINAELHQEVTMSDEEAFQLAEEIVDFLCLPSYPDVAAVTIRSDRTVAFTLTGSNA